ncbi:stage II sporulation protein M [Candidatus Pacearchaeota archaeon]|nr:stage II sporulation protein M [Candidatus Pacearchaeota archaeon]
MFEMLIKRGKAEKNPFEMFFIGFVYSSLAIPVGLYIFYSQASLVIVFLTVLASIHLMHGVMSLEEKKERFSKSEMWILREHGKAFLFFLFLFLGFVFSFSFWSVVLPLEVSEHVFSVQKAVIFEITSITGNASAFMDFQAIFRNNLKVLVLSFLFSLVYGAGVTFILAWNSSVIGFAIGNLARSELGLASLPFAFSKYLAHGLIEVLAFFGVALAGGILSIAIVKRDIKKKFRKILLDVFVLMMISIIMLVIAGLIEVYITPWI